MASFLRPTALKLRNFKGIAELDITLDESLTLLAGVNGVGKTSVLQGLVAAVTYVWHHIASDYPMFSFQENVVRAHSTGTELALELELPGKSTREFRFTVDGTVPCFDGSWLKLGQVFRDSEPFLPLVVYYEQNRVARVDLSWRDVSVSSSRNRKTSLHTTVSSPSEFKAWFFEKEADEGMEIRQRQNLAYADPELVAVRNLLKQLDGFTAIRSRKPPDKSERTLFLEKDGANIPFESLSGGEQAFFLLAADLARRLMLAAPSPYTTLEDAPGIVCIDEIELHLHPAWQRKILKTLMKTFPACQFIVTTHSPQVIGGVEAHHVRLLEPAENGVRTVSQPIATKGRDSNYVLKGILDTPERDDEVSRLFDEFDRLIDTGEMEKAGQVLDKLDDAVEGESSRVAVRRAKWNRLRRTEA
jgi:predicted ATP-binding protein involved in virulence